MVKVVSLRELCLKCSERNLQSGITELKVYNFLCSVVLLHIHLATDLLFDLFSMTYIFIFCCAFWLTGIVGIFNMYFSNLNFLKVSYCKYTKSRMLQQRDMGKVHCLSHGKEFIFIMGVTHHEVS